jgi:hypothetical protein
MTTLFWRMDVMNVQMHAIVELKTVPVGRHAIEMATLLQPGDPFTTMEQSSQLRQRLSAGDHTPDAHRVKHFVARCQSVRSHLLSQLLAMVSHLRHGHRVGIHVLEVPSICMRVAL